MENPVPVVDVVRDSELAIVCNVDAIRCRARPAPRRRLLPFSPSISNARIERGKET